MKVLASIGLRNGGVAGVLAFVLLISLYYMGRHPLMIAPYLDFRIIIFGIFIFFTLKEFRDYYQDKVLYYWQGVIGGMIVVMVANMISTIGMQIFGSVDHGFVEDYIVQLTTYLKTFPEDQINQIGKEVFERNLALLPSTNITELTIGFFVKGAFIGLFVCIIVATILRKQPKN